MTEETEQNQEREEFKSDIKDFIPYWGIAHTFKRSKEFRDSNNIVMYNLKEDLYFITVAIWQATCIVAPVAGAVYGLVSLLD